jgi:hypothetical protein
MFVLKNGMEASFSGLLPSSTGTFWILSETFMVDLDELFLIVSNRIDGLFNNEFDSSLRSSSDAIRSVVDNLLKEKAVR